jgi:hypothetical protein
VVLPDDDSVSEADRATAEDASACVRDLVHARSGVVLRYRPDRSPGTIRRYYADGRIPQDITLGARLFGIEAGQLPRYLLILASPEQVPWAFQFEVQHTCYTGRLDLQGAALERYVNAAITDWDGCSARQQSSLVWAVDHGAHDITRLMRDAITAPLHRCFANDEDYRAGARFLDGTSADASAAALKTALVEGHPAFVATSSHGMTAPLSDVDAMRASLGNLVDTSHQQVIASELLDSWKPNGAIWFAQACCSAGSRAVTAFEGLVPPDSAVDRVLKGVAACGETLSPFPRALLSEERPLRAFVGHVEPTFDWSVRHPQTGQYLTRPLLDAFYYRLFRGEPIGMALEACRQAASAHVHSVFSISSDRLGRGEDAIGDILAMRLVANDWNALVLLGDPAVTVAGFGPP